MKLISIHLNRPEMLEPEADIANYRHVYINQIELVRELSEPEELESLVINFLFERDTITDMLNFLKLFCEVQPSKSIIIHGTTVDVHIEDKQIGFNDTILKKDKVHFINRENFLDISLKWFAYLDRVRIFANTHYRVSAIDDLPSIDKHLPKFP
jgi:hypothetical protein